MFYIDLIYLFQQLILILSLLMKKWQERQVHVNTFIYSQICQAGHLLWTANLKPSHSYKLFHSNFKTEKKNQFLGPIYVLLVSFRFNCHFSLHFVALRFNFVLHFSTTVKSIDFIQNALQDPGLYFILHEVFSIFQYPILLKEDEFIKLWYKKDTKFKIPKGKIYLKLHNCQNVHC